MIHFNNYFSVFIYYVGEENCNRSIFTFGMILTYIYIKKKKSELKIRKINDFFI